MGKSTRVYLRHPARTTAPEADTTIRVVDLKRVRSLCRQRYSVARIAELTGASKATVRYHYERIHPGQVW